MEDRYLFKAKRIDNREWVQGALFDGESHCIIGQEVKFSPYTEHECKIVGYEVNRNTICQCTGLKDKNGKLIWENDVVKCLYNCYGEKYVYIGKVIYKEGTCRFVVANSKSTDYEWWNEEKEVIGNIFDNPELLESEE